MHKAKILTVQCIDLRFQQMVDEDIKKIAKYGEFDRISWPGASIDFENVLNSADISLRLHNPDSVVIYEHEDCGAYGENNGFEIHKINAQKLKDALLKKNPNLTISIKIATFKGVEEL